MSGTTKIEWTDATWNPVTGCTRVSPGCAHCYIEKAAGRELDGRTWDEYPSVGAATVGATTGGGR